MANGEKSEKKQNDKQIGKRQLIAMWTAIAAALGSTGIPKIIELLENKPSVAQVQTMIAKQTSDLTKEQHKAVDALAGMQEGLSSCQNTLGQLEERTSLLKEVLRDCCTRQHARERLGKPPGLDAGATMRPVEVKAKHPAQELHKVPDFNIQQQLQIPLEVEK